MAAMTPEVGACSGAEMRPPASAISWPRNTVSPIFTTGRAGAPECCDSGMTSAGGSPASAISSVAAGNLWLSGCTPQRWSRRRIGGMTMCAIAQAASAGFGITQVPAVSGSGCIVMAPVGHFSAHWLQPVQASSNTPCNCFIAPMMASDGHSR